MPRSTSGDLAAYIRAAWEDLTPQATLWAEAVYRLSHLGAVVSHAAHGISREGVDAEWRMVALIAVDGDLLSRCELFDETDLDAAIARFEELHPRARLENAATRVDHQLFALFVERRWEEMGALYAHDLLLDDRRQGLRRLSTDRATQINNVRAIADLGVADITQTPLALRGSRLCLSHVQYDIGDSRPDAFVAEMLAITEVDTIGVMVARIVFDLDDFEAAVAELDRRSSRAKGRPTRTRGRSSRGPSPHSTGTNSTNSPRRRPTIAYTTTVSSQPSRQPI